MVISPLVIILSSSGRNASIFSCESTISTTIGKSCDSRRILVVWMRLECPKPDWPRAGVKQWVPDTLSND